ncbi:hypothetical protein [Bacillus sp. FSL K6-3431]
MLTIYTQLDEEKFHDSANYFSTFLLYNGEPDQDDDPADFQTPLKGVRVA